MSAEARFYPWQARQRERLAGLHASDKLPHALLLAGPADLGKVDFACALAALLLCRSPAGDEPCGECSGCRLFNAGTHPDFRLIEPEASKLIRIEQIRDLIDWATQTAQRGGMKAVVIHPAEQMNASAANALLKCLEEPADNTLIMLVSDLPGRLLPTIRSRCQHVGFSVPASAEALGWLQRERPELSAPALRLAIAGGAPLAIERHFDDEFLGRRAQAVKATEGLLGGESPLEVAASLRALDTVEALDILYGLFADALRYSLTREKNMIKNKDMVKVVEAICGALGTRRLLDALDAIRAEQQAVASPSNPNGQLLLEALLVRIAGLCAL